MRGSRYPLTSRGPNLWSYRGFQIEREPVAAFVPARYCIHAGRGRSYHADSLNHARQIINNALDPLTTS